MEQDQFNAKTKVWTRPAIPRNNLFNLHSTGFGICKCGMGQLHALWKRRTREITEWGSKNCYRYYQTCFYTRSLHIHALYGKIGWDTLDSRRRKHKLTLFYKMYTNKTPPYLSTLVPPSVNIFSEYSLRNSNDTQTVQLYDSVLQFFFILNCQRME